ncbi:MAG: hypothetical protein LBK40_00390 [Spirochaetaceae bacterium]|jgi:hypothetical protein|nr:hypothetical protein [Spirochaetaceae bacterium]
MKKILILLAVLAILPLAQLAAQSSGYNVFSFDIGYAPSYNVNTGDTDSQTLFGFNVMVGNDLAAGFTLIGNSTAGFSLLTLKYQIIDRIKAQVSLGLQNPGGSPIPVSGLGFEYAPFTQSNNSLNTELKLRIEYLFPNNYVEQGWLFFGLALGVGV